MKIEDWLEKHSHPVQWLADNLDAAYPMVWRWVKNKATPSLKYIVAIEKLTGGAVGASDWLEMEQARDGAGARQ